MATSVRRYPVSKPFVVAALASLMALVLVGGVVFDYRYRPPPLAPEDPKTVARREAALYTGSIIIPSDTLGVCRHLLFDNRDGTILEAPLGSCLLLTLPAPSNSSEGRVTAIRDAFSKR